MSVLLTGCAAADFATRALGFDAYDNPDSSDASGSGSKSVDITQTTRIDEEANMQQKKKIIIVDSDSGNYIPNVVKEPDIPYEEIYDDENKLYSKQAGSSDEIVMRFAGDVCFYDGFSLMAKFKEYGSDIDNCIDASLLELMRTADIFMLNNEFPYSERGTPLPDKTYAFRAKPEHVEILNDMGVDIVSLANNHAYDWGPEALSDTFEVLKNAKVPFVGAGNNIKEAMMPVYFKVNGITVSFVSATQIERFGNPDTKEATESSPGVLRTLDPEKACRVIEEASANSDFTVMYVHWGSENTDLVEKSQRDLASAYVDAGADLIIGDHSHCLQGIDYIDDVPVFYSLGNYWFNSKRVDTGIAEIIIDSSRNSDGHADMDTEVINHVPIKSVRFIPAIQREYKTREVDKADSDRILSYLQGISDYAEVDIATGIIVKSDTNHNTQGGVNTSPTKKEEPDAAENIAENPVEAPIDSDL